MGYKRVSVETISMKPDSEVEGYLLSVTVSKNSSVEVPKFLFRHKTKVDERFSAFGGASLLDTIDALKVGALTKLVKGKARVSKGGYDTADWAILQDTANKL